jgi:hypothetical protein
MANREWENGESRIENLELVGEPFHESTEKTRKFTTESTESLNLTLKKLTF